MSANQVLDSYVQRFQNLPSWNVHMLSKDGMKSEPWFEVTGEDIAKQLIFDELNTMVQVDLTAAEIQKWGRLEAMTLRVWQLAERELRIWKARFKLKLVDSEEKTPAQHIMEARYRADKKYATLSAGVERAEEAYNATKMVTDAFKVKARLIERFARKYHDG